VRGNSHARFLGGLGLATAPGYPTLDDKGAEPTKIVGSNAAFVEQQLEVLNYSRYETGKETFMNYLIRIIAVSVFFFAVGCAHQINITPPLNTLDTTQIGKFSKNVGYFISTEDLSKEVTTPGGGGDKVKYFPYKECEPALNKILSNIFVKVYPLASANDNQFIKSNDISYVFIPKIETDSSSTSAFTWPPTNFTVSLDCKAFDSFGTVIWQKSVKGQGEAEFSEFKQDFPLAAKRAVKKAFSTLQEEIVKSGVF